MLVLPLVLWWAQAPMRFADRRLRIALSVVVITLIVSPVGNLANTAPADDRFGRESRRSGELRGTGVQRQRADTEEPRQLREGALVPPTAGRVVMLGRRWAFVSDAVRPTSQDELAGLQPSVRSETVAYKTKLRPTRLGMGNAPTARSNTARRDTFIAADASEDYSRPATVPRITMTENLMLQRIVEAIRADPSDDRWTISGEVTEFFNENRLIVRTAQRAN